MNTTAKVLIGTLAGLTVGAALGILFAPEKGTDTRKKISKKSKQYVDDVKEKFNELLGGISDKLHDAKKAALNLGHNGQAKVENTEHEVKALRG